MTALLCCRRSALSRYAHVADGSYPQPDWLIDRVPLEYSIEWLTCAIASRLDVMMVG